MEFVKSAGLIGIEGHLVTVECEELGGLPRLDLVGLPGAAVKESGDRVRSAIKNSGYSFPGGRLTINLAPADTRKEGPVYDVPIMLGLLAADRQIPSLPTDSVFIGELSLGGQLRPVNGVLSMALAAEEAGIRKLFLPAANAQEAAFAENLTLYPAENMEQILEHLQGGEQIPPYQAQPSAENEGYALDFAEVMGQENAKRALEVAAAGGHNILLCGSPGSGKSMMIKRFPSILPPMSRKEKLEVIRLYSAVGLGTQAALSDARPFRSPHHTASAVSLTGGGNQQMRPGEISLAHNGVLFLDELPEFSKYVLETLRQPLEDGKITITRAAGSAEFPSRFQLLAAMNPCKCGWYGHASGRCHCTPESVKRYRSRISGPLLDRIDIQLEIQPVEYTDLTAKKPAESSAAIRERVMAAREIQKQRFAGTSILSNRDIPAGQRQQYCPVSPEGEKLIQGAFERLGMTARSYDRVLKVARTIADLAGEKVIGAAHLAEAIQYRFSQWNG